MDSENNKGKPLSRQETKTLLQFIEGSKVVNMKTYNAATNKLKINEWNRIAEGFNTNVKSYHRTPQQLRLKWENLKKTARKRQSSGERKDCIAPDDILDRVSDILNNTVEVLPESENDIELRNGDEVIASFVVDNIVSEAGAESTGSVDPLNSETLREVEVDLRDASVCFAFGEQTEPTPTSTKDTPRTNGYKRKQKPDEGRTARNVAIAQYYTVKKKLLEGKLNNIILQNEKLRLELEKLKNSL